jgi:hypothetical protein
MSKQNCYACGRRENVNHLGLCDQCAEAEEMATADMLAAREEEDGKDSERGER